MLATPWRLIRSGRLPGPRNMAIDEALLTCFDPHCSTPVLRLYGWSPPALSVGRFQDAATIDLGRCRELGVPVVRRVTGGGAIYHAEELTYGIVCAPHHLPPAATIKETFRVLTGFLLGFYRGLGLSARYAVESAPPGARLGERTPFCFAGQESYDILVQGKKIGGNAQRRRKEVIFQHGSIPLADSLATAMQLVREHPAGLAAMVTDLGRLGVTAAPEELEARLAEAFAVNLGVELVSDALTAEEAARAEALAGGKYGSDDWNLRGEEP
ncbi:MAG: lipoate--protein ligase family protein [Geobacter sp.]|nr:lipoate--protein ligase family protein [Geobacter sp.]